MNLLTSLWSIVCPDRRPEREKARERGFIQAANSLKTLRVTPEGGMSIDPEEIREQIIASREQLKHFVHKPGAPSTPFNAAKDVQVEQEASPTAEAPVIAMDCIEVVTWRRLQTGDAVRYACLQSTSTGCYAVATASLFLGGQGGLPFLLDANINRKITSALLLAELRWFKTVSEAMDAWDAEL